MDMNMKMNCSTDSSMTMSMQMWFYATANATILFKKWETSTAAQMVGACVAWFAIAFGYEAMKIFREILLKRHLEYQKKAHLEKKAASYGVYNAAMDVPTKPKPSQWLVGHSVQTIIHMIQLTISYLLMLVVMTYNAWLCIAVILGSGAGYFAFGWKRSLVEEMSENLHNSCH